MARPKTQFLLALISLALAFTASACLDSDSDSKSCDPREDRDCFCTLDDDGVKDITEACINGTIDDIDRCTCEFGDPRPDPNPGPNPDPNPGPNPDPNPGPNPEPTPDPEPEPDPAPVLLDQVARVAWGWRSDDPGVVTSYLGRSQPAAFSNLVEEPEPILALFDGRRLIGGDCVAYVEDDLTQRDVGGLSPQPIPAQPQSDIGQFNTFFLDTSGEDLFQIVHNFNAETKQYDFESLFERVDNPTPAAGNVRIFAQGRGPIHEEPGDTSRGLPRPEPVNWSLRGTQAEVLQLSDNVPAVYFAFDMVGDNARAHVHCSKQASGGAVRIAIPDLSELAAEIGWEESREAPPVALFGATNISDPLRSGFYGVVEQALNGPEFMFEEFNAGAITFSE